MITTMGRSTGRPMRMRSDTRFSPGFASRSGGPTSRSTKFHSPSTVMAVSPTALRDDAALAAHSPGEDEKGRSEKPSSDHRRKVVHKSLHLDTQRVPRQRGPHEFDEGGRDQETAPQDE